MACRLCLQVFKDYMPLTDSEWMNALPNILPQISLDLTVSPRICEECYAKLQEFENLRDICRQAVNKINSILSQLITMPETNYVISLKDIFILDETQKADPEHFVCRICLQNNQGDHYSLYGNNIYVVFIKSLFLELNLENIYEPVLCKQCGDKVEEMYLFQQMCLDVENMLQDYASNDKLSEEAVADFAKDIGRILKVDDAADNLLEEKQDTRILDEENLAVAENKADLLTENVPEQICETSAPLADTIEIAETTTNLTQELVLKQSENFTTPVFVLGYIVSDMETVDVLTATNTTVDDAGTVPSQVLITSDAETAQEESRSSSNLSSSDNIQKDDKTQMYRCPYCKASMKQKHHLKEHIIVKHTDCNKTYQCQFCSYKAVLERYLKTHVKSQHLEQNILYECVQCAYTTKRKDTLKKHMRARHTKRCSYCAYTVNEWEDLTEHLKSEHGLDNMPVDLNMNCDTSEDASEAIEPKQEAAEESKAYYECEECGFKGFNEECVLKHIRRKHEKREKEEVWHTCDFCKYKTKRRHDLKRHITKKHST